MSLSTKRALLNYLGFLKSSGFLYMEPDPRNPVPEPIVSVKGEVPKTGANPRERKPADRVPAQRGPASAEFTEPDLFAPPRRALPAESGTPSAKGLPRDERIARLQEALEHAEACRACALGTTRNKIVYGDGDPEARIVFVGEAPGGEENATGIPFVGRAGQLLNKMIGAIGFERREVYICNTLKCRPPDNRDPLPSEKKACEHFLIGQLDILRPQILVALGTHAAQYLCRSDLTIGKLRGRWHQYHGIPLRATYHPAFLLRSPGFKAQSWEDFKAIHARYCEMNPGDARKIWSKEG